jgi:hypothetical protein
LAIRQGLEPTIITFRDRYQDALRQLIEAKTKGLTIKPPPAPKPSPVIDLVAALKRSLAREALAAKRTATKAKPSKAAPDRRQAAMLLPLSGGRRKQDVAVEPGTIVGKRRRKS